MIRTVISKVHTTHQGRWNRRAIEIRKNKKREADFSDFVEFIEMEATLLSDPAYSRDALFEAKPQVKSFSTKISEAESSPVLKCYLCGGVHDVEDCEEYLGKDVNERHKIIFRQKLCFSCLTPVTSDHLAKSCQNKKKCRVCNSGHPTTLHGDKAKSVNHSSLEDDVISMCVVPILLHHKDNPKKQVTVYALLDDCSQATFIQEDILDTLNVPQKRETFISVKTLNGERCEQSFAVDGLVVQPIPTHSSRYTASCIKLPRAYSQSARQWMLRRYRPPQRYAPGAT